MSKNWTQTKDATFDRTAALKMNDIAKNVFASIYPVIARNAMTVTGIRRGVCLEVGTGHALLAIAVAREAPEMDIVAFDFSSDARQIASENIAAAQLGERIRSMAGDVHAMPFADDYADLIISRGSMFFWEGLQDAFREIYRVLAPGGATYIGGGFGSCELREQVIAEMLQRNPTWDCYAGKKADAGDIQRFAEMFQELGCQHHRIINDETGFWVVLSKPGLE